MDPIFPFGRRKELRAYYLINTITWGVRWPIIYLNLHLGHLLRNAMRDIRPELIQNDKSGDTFEVAKRGALGAYIHFRHLLQKRNGWNYTRTSSFPH